MHRRDARVPADRSRPEDRLRATARSQHGVITRAQILDAGFHPDVTRRRVRSGRLTVLHRGVYGVGEFLPPRAPLMAAQLACGPRAAISHLSAGALLGLVVDRAGADVDVTIPRRAHRVRSGIRLHRIDLDDDEVSIHDGLRITTPIRTLVDLAPWLEDDELERASAHAERERLVAPADLTAALDRYGRRPGIGRLRTLVDRIDGPRLTRSEAERKFLALIRRAKLPAPRANVRVAEFEVDFLWPELNLAIEVDGYRFHGSRNRFESDRRRAVRLASLGIQVVPLTWRQIVDDELATAALLGQVIARAGQK